jgi:cysteine desulfurase
MARDTQVIGLDLAGVAVSAGSACSSGKVHASHVLSAMGVPDDLATAAIRVSLGWSTEQPNLDRFVDAWYEIRVAKSIGANATEMQKAS